MLDLAKVQLVFKGFDDLLEQIKAAEGQIEPAVERAMTSSANLVTAAIKSGAVARNVPTDTLIKPAVKWEGGKATCEVGFKLGSYFSDSYIALFKEYGTAKRSTKKGYNRGSLTADPFIRPAIDSNKNAVKKAQQEALQRILKGLQT